MTVNIRIPANMRSLAGEQALVEVFASTVGEALDKLVGRYPELRPRLLDDSGELQSFVNVFLQEQSVRDLQGLDTPLGSSDEVLIIPALAGG